MNAEKNGQFYIVATPIGNLSEITFRAVETLKSADVILCEDTRHSLKLLNHLNISKPLVSYHKFNEKQASDKIIEQIKSGKNIALISDAGMPGICDPGGEIIKKCVDNGIEYTVISGASAVINALVLSGLSTGRFCFCGFLPEKSRDKKQLISEISSLTATLVFYSSPHNLVSDTEYLYSELGARKVSVIKEISKLHESVERTELGQPLKTEVKGEYVLVIEGAKKSAASYDGVTIEEQLEILMSLGVEEKDAVKQVAKERNLAKNEIYQLNIKVKQQTKAKQSKSNAD